MTVPIDSFDAKILVHLQQDGRLTSVQLSRLVALSQSPTNRRMTQLREDGVIQRTIAVVDPRVVGWPVRVNVVCSLERTTPDAHEVFLAALCEDPVVSDVDVVMGGPDFLFDVRARSMEGYNEWLRRYHGLFPNLRDVKSYAVLDEVKRYGPVPVDIMGPDHE